MGIGTTKEKRPFATGDETRLSHPAFRGGACKRVRGCAVKIFHPLLVEAVRDARPLDEEELRLFAESIRDQVRPVHAAPVEPPLFKWARRAVEGSRIS